MGALVTVACMASIWVGDRVRLRGVEPEEWVQNVPTTPDDDQFGLGIESLTEERLVGGISTNDIDKNAGVFSYGVTIGAGFQGRLVAALHVRRAALPEV